MSLLVCGSRYSFFVLEILKFEWQCIQNFELNPKCVIAAYAELNTKLVIMAIFLIVKIVKKLNAMMVAGGLY